MHVDSASSISRQVWWSGSRPGTELGSKESAKGALWGSSCPRGMASGSVLYELSFVLNHDSSPSLAVSGSTPHNSDCDVPASLLAWATQASWGEVWLTLRCSSGCHGAQATGSELANIGPQRTDISLGCWEVALTLAVLVQRGGQPQRSSLTHQIASLPSSRLVACCEIMNRIERRTAG